MVAVMVLLVFGSEARALQSLAVGWNASTATNVSGYAVYYGSRSGDYTMRLDAGTNTAVVITGLEEGQTNYFVVKPYTAQQIEGPPSNEISFIVPGIIAVSQKATVKSPAQIEFSVAPGHSYKVQASVNLMTWSTIWEKSATTNGWVEYEDPEGANLKERFYRLVME